MAFQKNKEIKKEHDSDSDVGMQSDRCGVNESYFTQHDADVAPAVGLAFFLINCATKIVRDHQAHLFASQ